MYSGMAQEARLVQTLSPRMIQFYELLQCPMPELERLVSEELARNPALELVDLAEPGPTEDLPTSSMSLHDLAEPGGYGSDEETDDPMASLPALVSLQDHLRWHYNALAKTEDERRIGRRIIDQINSDGYFEGSIGEVAMALGANVVLVERVLALVQQLEPIGVGARDLRECLQIQLRALAEQGREHVVARRVLEECWEAFARNQHGVCARKLGVSEAAVADAAEFLRRHCHPYPGREWRAPWAESGATPAAWPEVRIYANDEPPPPYLAEALETPRLALRIDRVYRRLYEAIEAGAREAPEATEHVRTCVRRARQFIECLTQRRETVRQIAQEVANLQADFLARGPAHLKPLTRIEIARRLGIHESTVGRAVAGKHVILPGGELAPFEVFFDSAQPARLAIEQMIAEEDPARPLSDQTIARRLAEMGYDVARRTVAKYRGQLKIPPASQRRRR